MYDEDGKNNYKPHRHETNDEGRKRRKGVFQVLGGGDFIKRKKPSSITVTRIYTRSGCSVIESDTYCTRRVRFLQVRVQYARASWLAELGCGHFPGYFARSDWSVLSK